MINDRTSYEYGIKDISCNNKDLSKYRVEPKDHFYSLGLSLTNECNLKCPFCYYQEPQTSLAHNSDKKNGSRPD